MTIVMLGLFGAFILFSFIYFAIKNKKPFKRAFISLLFGLVTFFVVDLLSFATHVYIPVSAFSVLVSAFGGVPGVALLVMMSVI